MREVRKRLIDQNSGSSKSIMLLLFPFETNSKALFRGSILIFFYLAILNLIINQLYEFIILRTSFILW